MYEKIKAYIEAQGMLEQQDTVIAGISGGADSICLLCVLEKLMQEYELRVIAVHINHGLRGKTAERDERYVENICKEKKIPLEIFHLDVKRLAKEEGRSEEEAGRVARRRAFEQVAEKYENTGAGRVWIALAHHQNDNAETLLLNLARGTGLRGLGGMRPMNGKYIRPLLGVSRKEIERFLKEENVFYCTDETNEEDAYTRNRIRNHVIPYLEEEVNGKFTEHACQVMEQMADLWEYVNEQIRNLQKTCVRPVEGRTTELFLEEHGFLKTPKVLRPYLIRQVLEQVSGHSKDLEVAHMKAVEELFDKQTGKYICLPYQMKAVRGYEGVRIFRDLSTGKETQKKEPDVQVEYRILDREEANRTFPQTPYTKRFDYDIIKDKVTIRTRLAGDYLTIDQYGRTQKLKQYFINEKIPREERNQTLLAADGSRIMWIVGCPRDFGYGVTEYTKKILEITIYGGEKDGRDR